MCICLVAEKMHAWFLFSDTIINRPSSALNHYISWFVFLFYFSNLKVAPSSVAFGNYFFLMNFFSNCYFWYRTSSFDDDDGKQTRYFDLLVHLFVDLLSCLFIYFQCVCVTSHDLLYWPYYFYSDKLMLTPSKRQFQHRFYKKKTANIYRYHPIVFSDRKQLLKKRSIDHKSRLSSWAHKYLPPPRT